MFFPQLMYSTALSLKKKNTQSPTSNDPTKCGSVTHLLAPDSHQEVILLTVQPLGVIFDRPLELVDPEPGRDVVQVGPEDHSIRFRELGHGSTVQTGQSSRVSVF